MKPYKGIVTRFIIFFLITFLSSNAQKHPGENFFDPQEKNYSEFWERESARYTVPADGTFVDPGKLEKVQEITTLSDGAPEIYDDERTEPWKRIVTCKNVLKRDEGGNYSYFAANIGGQEVILALTAAHIATGLNPGDENNMAGRFLGESDLHGIFGETVASIGPGPAEGDTDPTSNKFTIVQVTGYEGYRDTNDVFHPADANMWRPLRTFPIAQEPIDSLNPGYITTSTQSGKGNFTPPIPYHGPEGVFISPVNLDAVGSESPETKLSFGTNYAHIPIHKFNPDSANVWKGSSGGPVASTSAKISTQALSKKTDVHPDTTRYIVDNYEIQGPIEGGSIDNGILEISILQLGKFIPEIKQAFAQQFGVSVEEVELFTEDCDFEVNGDGEIRKVGRVIDTITSVDDSENSLPTGYTLEQNYPNPFNPSTTIAYSIPVVDVPSLPGRQTGGVEGPHVSLIVYDLLGREVSMLVNKQQQPGSYKVEFDADGLTSGIYFYKLMAGNFSQTRKMLLVR